jgi:hypothetical protein
LISETGAALGAGEVIGNASSVNIMAISIHDVPDAIFLSNHSVAVGALDASIGSIRVSQSNLMVIGDVGFGTRANTSDIAFFGPIELNCLATSDAHGACFHSENVTFSGRGITVFVRGRSLAGRRGTPVLSSDGTVHATFAFDLPSIPEEFGEGSIRHPSLHFGRFTPSTVSNFTFSICPDGTTCDYTMEVDTDLVKSFHVLLPIPASYRFTYVEKSTQKHGVVKDSQNNELFAVPQGELFIPRGFMIDDVVPKPFEFEAWHILLIIISVAVFLYLVFLIVILVTQRQSAHPEYSTGEPARSRKPAKGEEGAPEPDFEMEDIEVAAPERKSPLRRVLKGKNLPRSKRKKP